MRDAVTPLSGGHYAPRTSVTLILGLVAALVAIAPARQAAAGLVLKFDDLPVLSPGASGTFDVYATNNGAPSDPGIDIGGFTVQINAAGPIQFIDASMYGTAYPYIFPTSTTSPLYTNPALPTSQLIINDTEPTLGFQTINPGEKVALGHISYTVDPGAPTPYSITLSDHASGNSSIADGNSNDIFFTVENGAIGVPLPAAAPVGLALLGAMLAGRRFRGLARAA